MTERVLMRSPEGEVREVEATVEALSPLMARGWKQVDAEAEAESEVPDAGEHS